MFDVFFSVGQQSLANDKFYSIACQDFGLEDNVKLSQDSLA